MQPVVVHKVEKATGLERLLKIYYVPTFVFFVGLIFVGSDFMSVFEVF